MENENQVETEVIVEKNSGVCPDILEAVKNNWWKWLLGGVTAAAAFAAGIIIGNNDHQEEAANDIEDAAL